MVQAIGSTGPGVSSVARFGATVPCVNGSYGQQGPWQGQAPAQQGGYQQPGPQWNAPAGPQWGGGQGQWGGQPQWGGQSSFGGWGGQQQPQYQQPQGQQPPYQPFPPSPQKRRKNPVPLVMLIVVCVLGLGILGVYAMRDTGGSIVGPDYQNEDYEIPPVRADQPPLPEPTTMDEVVDWLENNAWYAQTLPEPIRCELTGSEMAADMDNLAIQERFDEFINCLTRAVGPSLEAAGLIPITPRFTVYGPGTEVTTQCGTAPSRNAFYCPADQTLYLAPDIPDLLPSEQATAAHLFDFIMAHEYAHAMQGRTGILISSLVAQYYAEDEPEAMEYGRRIELQADCFASTMLTSLREDVGVSSEDFQGLSAVAREIGDDSLADRFGYEYVPDESSHGSGANREGWSLRGAEQLDVGVCNTFTAPAGEVS